MGKIKDFKVKEAKAGRKGPPSSQVKVAWYYRPEECKAGRRVGLFECLLRIVSVPLDGQESRR